MTSIIRLGRLVRDPEQKDVNGKSLTKFTVVEDSSRKDQSGKPYAVFVNCTMWGKGGDTIMQYVKKGDPVSLVGEFYQREYTIFIQKLYFGVTLYISAKNSTEKLVRMLLRCNMYVITR